MARFDLGGAALLLTWLAADDCLHFTGQIAELTEEVEDPVTLQLIPACY